MTKRKTLPWVSVVGGLVGCLTLIGIIFGNVAAFGKQSAKNEEVAKTVEKLDAKVDEQAEALTETRTEQRVVGEKIEAINDKLSEQKATMAQILDAVSRTR